MTSEIPEFLNLEDVVELHALDPWSHAHVYCHIILILLAFHHKRYMINS